jgi:hypothetical protein
MRDGAEGCDVRCRLPVLQQILSWIETVDVTPPKKAANA